MNLPQFLELLQLVSLLGSTFTGGDSSVGPRIEALVEIAKKAAEMYQAEAGQPLDLSKLPYAEPIE